MRTLAACVLALTFGACDRPDSTSTTTLALDGLDAVELERAAAEPWLRHDKQSPEIEAALAKALLGGYAANPATPDGHAALVRTALVEWAARVRHQLGDGLHTAVPAFADDPECRGSLIGDQALIGYVDAITRGEPRERDVVAALDAFARQLACIGELQSVQLADAMTHAFADVEDGLARNQLAEAVPLLVQAVSQPMLLVHDIERRRGPDAPLAVWFAEHEHLLREGAVIRRHPSAWHGLWLYDRITGRLRGFRVADDATDDNTVDLDALFEFIARAPLSGARCSLAEVVQRGTRGGAYACLAEACARGEVDPKTCAQEVDGGGGGGGDAGGGGGVSIPGMSSGGLLACITTQTASPTESQLQCLSEATGWGASPRGFASKGIDKVGMAGAKIGGQCDLMDQAVNDYNRRVKRAQEDYEFRVQQAREALRNANDAYKAAREELDAALAIDPNSGESTAAQKEVDAAKEKVNQEAARFEKAKAEAAAKREADRKAAEEALRKAQQAAAAAGSGSGSGSGSGTGSDGGDDERCVDGSQGCGNGCSAITAEIQAMLDCVLEPTTPETLDPLGGCGLACDPLDPEESKSGLACVETLAENPLSKLSAACWSVRCGPNSETAGAAGCCGSDGRTIGGELQLPDPCATAHCTGGRPAGGFGGTCTCGGTGGVIPGGPELTGFPPR
jgi:hypothetical protein